MGLLQDLLHHKGVDEHHAVLEQVQAEQTRTISQPRRFLYSATIWMRRRIASSEMLPRTESLPHLICSPAVFSRGGVGEAGQHGDT